MKIVVSCIAGQKEINILLSEVLISNIGDESNNVKLQYSTLLNGEIVYVSETKTDVNSKGTTITVIKNSPIYGEISPGGAIIVNNLTYTNVYGYSKFIFRCQEQKCSFIFGSDLP